ncbi:MAG TPA: cytochrome c [Candidatus Acidoferrales bacterium]|nr:cytochrome c [Candidatus Acidoferrales bacterium]
MKAIKSKLGIAAIVGLAAIGVLRTASRAQESAQPTRSVWDGVYTAEQEKRGAVQYTNTCAQCHGEDLAGSDEAAPLTGSDFLANWDGLTVGDLADRVLRTMPQNDPGHLTRQQVADILSHVLKFNGFPAGKTELDSKREVENQIRIEAAKPSPKSE